MQAYGFRPVKMLGFSLIELSIVLVILGLLTGGILTGASLIRAAELRSVVSEFQSYQLAAQTFKGKYFALPGDLTNATRFWGEVSPGSSCDDGPSHTMATCDGNGDGKINRVLTGHSSQEYFSFWKHLSNAGLISGEYTGVNNGSGGLSREADINVPSSKFSNGMWFTIYGSSPITHESLGFDFPAAANYLLLDDNPFNGIPALMVAEEIWSIDTKLDDGMPATGLVRSSGRVHYCTDASSVTDYGAQYTLGDSDKECSIAFWNVY